MKISKKKMREDLQRKRGRTLGMAKGKYNFKSWVLLFQCFGGLFFFSFDI